LKTADSLASYAGAIDTSTLSEQEKTWAYEAALIKLAVSFEHRRERLCPTIAEQDAPEVEPLADHAARKAGSGQRSDNCHSGGGTQADIPDRRGRDGSESGAPASLAYRFVELRQLP
jgi:hypothetical protein